VDAWRKERIAKNEASFREINERLEQGLRQVQQNPELLTFICECGEQTCERHVHLSLSEYERVRLDSRHFAVVPGHIFPAVERVIARNERYEVVEKFGETTEITDETDRRSPDAAGRREDPAHG
jgi:L-lysine 2,3-aminomutase